MATAVVPKKNYRAALLRPAPPKPKVSIFTPHPEEPPFGPIVEDCIGNVVAAEPGYLKSPEIEKLPMRAVVEFEEEELKQFQSQKGIFYSKFKSILEWLATKLNKNVLAFVGHSDVIDDYFGFLNMQLQYGHSPVNSALETIVLLVGCYTGEYAYQANRQEYVDQGDPWNSPRSPYNPYQYLSNAPFFFFGFQRLMHIYQADLYMCQEPQTNMKSISCLYPKALDDKEALLSEPNDKTNPLRKCCTAKYDRFKSMFVEDLNTRDCVQFTKEELLAKIQAALKPDGSIDSTKIMEADYCIFKARDGKQCPSPGCKIQNPYKGAERYAESFDNAEELMLLGHELFVYAAENTDEKIMNRLQSLKPKEQPVVWMKNFLIPSKVLLFELLNYNHYKATAACLKLFPIPLHTLGYENKNFFSWGADLTDWDESKLYDLFLLFLNKSPLDNYSKGYYLRGYYDIYNHNTLYYILYCRRKMLLELYLSILGNHANIDYADNNTNWKPALCIVADSYNFDPQFWKYLLAYGANPNAYFLDKEPPQNNKGYKGVQVLEYILEHIPPPFPKEVLLLLCIYGTSGEEALRKVLLEYQKALLEGSEERNTFLQQVSISLGAVIQDMDLLREKYKTSPEKFETDYNYFINTYVLDKLTTTINNPDAVLKESIETFELCLRILKSSPERKRKIQAKLREEAKQTVKEVVAARAQTKTTRNELPKLYKILNQSLKRPNVRIQKNMKKTFRNKGLFLLRNNTQTPENRVTKLQQLIDMVLGTQPETVSTNNNFVGGRKTRKMLKRRR